MEEFDRRDHSSCILGRTAAKVKAAPPPAGVTTGSVASIVEANPSHLEGRADRRIIALAESGNVRPLAAR